MSEASQSAEDTYTAPQAARVLGISDRRVRQMLEAGELEGEGDSSGKWRIPQRVVHEVLKDRGSRTHGPKKNL
jgi:excisionase family DNA binding protein